MKKQKVLVPFLFILVFFIVFLGCSVLWKDGWWHSKAEDEDTTTTSTDIGVLDPNKSGQTLISFDTTFYNYRYDNELSANNATRNQGKQSCYDGGVIPFGEFDSALSKYYKENGVNVGIYTGNFYNYYGGLPGVGANKKTFPGYYNFKWAANIANRTSPYDSVCQGIVENKLEDFDISKNNFGTLMTATTKSDGTTGKVKVPYFDKGFLTEDNKVNGVAIGAVKEGVKFPFRKITSGSKSGYYEFDSTKDVIKFDGMETGKPSSDTYYYGNEGKLQYYYDEEKVNCNSSSSAQFFPFNKKTDGQSDIDYGFGVRFDIPFFLSEDGKLNGKNMVFEFSGDDDVWIFLDGNLIMDLGGQHGKSTGTIDFGATKTVDGETIGGAIATVSSVTRVKASTLATETAMSDAILAEDTYIQHNVQSDFVSVKKGDTEKHVITIFYMERGMFESNFHMAFNFVPEGQPMPTPMPTANPNDVDIKGGTLKIQNKMVFPTTTPDAKDSTESKINEKFLQTVKDLAEDDVFRYSVQNQGTKATHVLGNEFSYPSGKLTVRRNDNTTKKENSYLSFSERENVVRVYFDIGAAEALIAAFTDGYQNYTFPKNDELEITLAKKEIKGGTAKTSNLVPYKESYDSTTKKYKYYYMDIEEGTLASGEDAYFKILVDGSQVKGVGGDPQVKLHIPKVKVTSIRDLDGKLFKPLSIKRNGHNDKLIVTTSSDSNIIYDNTNISLTEGKDYKWEDANKNSDKHPKYSGGEDSSSVGLPYQDAGTENANKFTPDSASSGFLDVSNTAFELTEAYLAPTTDPNSSETRKILKNSDSTTGITDSNGCFALFYDDSATFKKQFSTESQMKVVQKEDLLKPSRYPETSLSETVPAATALTTFTPYESGKERKTANYYYTTVKAESTGISNDDANVTTTAAISVSSDGRYNYSNASAISTNSDVDITQTFTNTVKYGSLTISKELKGHMDADTNHSYGFEVTFSNVFGGTSTEAEYTGDYILVETDGTQTPKNITNDGDIILQPNQKAIITGIPVGTTYKVEELGAYVGDDFEGDDFEDDGSVVSKIQAIYEAQAEGETITSPTYTTADENSNVTTLNKSTKTIAGVIPCSIVNKAYLTETNEFSEVNVSVAFTNQFGALTITKKIAGDVNNSSYYGTDEKKYTFIVTDEDGTAYSSKYFVYTHKYENGPNLPPTVTKSEETAEDGKIILTEGQEAEIGGIPLDDASQKRYTIQEVIEETDIYFVESVKVTSGTEETLTTGNDSVKNNNTHNTTITTQVFNSEKPTFDVIFTNRYSNAYIKIDKFIDKLYCGDKKYADYTDDSGKTDITYQELTNAKQSFIFKVKQYKTLDNAKNDEKSEGSFNVVLNIASDASSVSLTDTGKTIVDWTKAYQDSKTVKVLANRYYRIEEDTNWSWRYIFKGVSQQDTNGNSITQNNKVVILKTYLDALNNIDDGVGKVVPIAEFYNALDTTKEDIEGDTDSIPNEIKKE